MTLEKILSGVRTQHNAAFRMMAVQGGRWHLYRVPGTDRFPLMREDAKWDIPVPPIAVQDVQCMTADRLTLRVQDILRGMQ